MNKKMKISDPLNLEKDKDLFKNKQEPLNITASLEDQPKTIKLDNPFIKEY